MAKVNGADATHVFNVPNVTQHDVDPTADDDMTGGYSVGDEWLNTVSGAFFKCGSAAEGEAAWGSFVTVAPTKRPAAAKAKDDDEEEKRPAATAARQEPSRQPERGHEAHDTRRDRR